MALEEAYSAEEKAELARAAREKATQEADILVKTEIEKRRIELEAEARAEESRRLAKGEADAIFMKMEAQARGMQEMLTKQAQGFAQLVAAAGGNAVDATRLLLADKMEDLMKIQVDAVKNLKIDKVTVWDSMGGKDGTPATANFLSGMLKSIPPMNELYRMAGLELPDYLGKEVKASDTVKEPLEEEIKEPAAAEPEA